MRLALGVEYEGTNYHGFQRQRTLTTIQAVLEAAISRVANHPVDVICAGRTDAGVHAKCQVIHFDTHATRALNAWVLGTNSNLPVDIRVQWVKVMNEQFSARFSALSRSYRYVIENQVIRSALMRNFVTWYPTHLDTIKMDQAAQCLMGELDFSAFRSSNCQSLTAFRRMEKLSVQRNQNLVIFELKANAFLHHMVRNIVGVLVEIGSGKKTVEWCKEVLDSRDRSSASVTMPASGLCLMRVEYPACWGLEEKASAY